MGEPGVRKLELFNLAADIADPRARDTFLKEACVGDPQLRADIEELLQHDANAGSFLAGPAAHLAVAVSHPDSERPATRIGPFKLLKQLGQGGMGVVYEAEQLSLGRRVALKILPFAALLNETQLERFNTEATAAARLQHSSIVTVYSVGCARGIHFIAMQLIEGPSLSDVIAELRQERHPDDKEQASAETVVARQADVLTRDEDGGHYRAVARIGREAAEALHYAHENGVLHRDIKPSNLLLDKTGHVWIADFGLARVEDESQLTRTGDILGTLRYMSPQQATGEKIDARSDVYSLGATLYELAALKPVFDNADRREVIKQVVAGNPVAPHKSDSRIPRPLSLVISKAMTRRLDERYQSAQELADDLGRFLEGEAVHARPPRLLRRTSVSLCRRPVVTIISTSLLLVMCLSIALIAYRFGAHEPKDISSVQLPSSHGNRNTNTGDSTLFRNAAKRRSSRSRFTGKSQSSSNLPAKNGRFRRLRHEQLEDRRMLSFSYADFSNPTGLNLVGDVATVGNVLRLTPNQPYVATATWYQDSQPVSVDFETTFDFQLAGPNGFAFVIQNNHPFAMGSSGVPYDAIPNSLAIEFDTLQDSRLDDPSHSHLSVHTNGTSSNSPQKAFSLGWVNTFDLIPGFELGDGQVHTATIRYEASPGQLEVYLDDYELLTPALTVSIDLSETLDLDAGRAWVGFTGGTDCKSPKTHDILNWEFTSIADTTPAIAISDVEQIEAADGSSAEFFFAVHRFGSTAGTVMLDWNTADGTASAGSDYVVDSGPLTIPEGVSQAFFTVTVNGDGIREGREYFFVQLTNTRGAVVADGQARGSILDNASNATFELSSLLEANGGDGSSGFAVGPLDLEHYSLGESSWIGSAGDVNGDGFDDMVVAAARADADDILDAGQTYIVFGAADGFPASLDPALLDGNNGFAINESDAAGGIGSFVGTAGDVNGDGLGDLVVMNTFWKPWDTGSRRRYVLFGSANGFPAEMDLSTLNGSNGFTITANGWGEVSGGDINGDGFSDLIVGAANDAINGPCAYVVFGQATGYAANINATQLNGENGFAIRSIDSGGWHAALAGDVNGDGFDDMVIGNTFPSSNGPVSGEAYVVFGRATDFGASFELSSLDGGNGFVISGQDTGDLIWALDGAGDINSDGYDDVIIGTKGGSNSYLVFGKANGFSSAVELSALDGTNGFAIRGVDASDTAGSAASGAGDVNGDGFDDLIIGARNADPNGNDMAGETYVIYGKTDGFASELDLSTLDGMTGFVVLGIAPFDRSGAMVSAAGDVNGDGYGDVIIGASFARSDGFSRGGEAYVVFGSDRIGSTR